MGDDGGGVFGAVGVGADVGVGIGVGAGGGSGGGWRWHSVGAGDKDGESLSRDREKPRRSAGMLKKLQREGIGDSEVAGVIAPVPCLALTLPHGLTRSHVVKCALRFRCRHTGRPSREPPRKFFAKLRVPTVPPAPYPPPGQHVNHCVG